MKIGKVKYNTICNDGFTMKSNFHLNYGKFRLSNYVNKGGKYSTLVKEVSNIHRPGIFKRVFVEKEAYGYKYITASSMMQQDSLSSAKNISKKFTPWVDAMTLRDTEILVSCAGTVGNVRLITKELENVIGSQDIIRVVPFKHNYGYIYAYLSSPTCYNYLQSLIYGSVVPRLDPKAIEKIPIPLLPEKQQEEIHQLIVDAAQLRVDANRLLGEAEKYFLSLLNIKDELYENITNSKEKSSTNSFSINSQNISAFTLRGRNYSPRKKAILDVLTNTNSVKLSEVLQNLPHYGARFKRIESSSSTSIELLSQGDIFDSKPNGRRISTRNINGFEKEIVRKGTILIPAQGTLGENEIFGRAKFVWGYLENKLVAGHAMRFIPNEDKIGSGYLFCVLSSKLWFRLLRNTVYGTNLLGFIVELIKNYPIPRFQTEDENKIDKLVKKSYDNLTLALQKENQAIQLIENEISTWQMS